MYQPRTRQVARAGCEAVALPQPDGSMHEITVYQRGARLDIAEFAGAKAVRLRLAPGVSLKRSPHSGGYAFFRTDGTFGLDLQAAFRADWCRWAPEEAGEGPP